MRKIRLEKKEEASDYLNFVVLHLGKGSLEDGILAKCAMEKRCIEEKKEVVMKVKKWALSLEELGTYLMTMWLVAGPEVVRWMSYGDILNYSETALHWDTETREERKSYKGALLDEKELCDFLGELGDGVIPYPVRPSDVPGERPEWGIIREDEIEEEERRW